MKKRLAALFFFFYVSTCLAVPVDEILQTPHFLIISLFKCQTTIESNIGENRCPSVLTRTSRLPECLQRKNFVFQHLHLIRDPNLIQPPKLLYLLGQSGGFVHFSVENINIPIVTNKSEIATFVKDVSPSTMTLSALNTQRVITSTDISSSIFDNESQLLYILSKRGPYGQPACFVYALRSVFEKGGKPSLEYVYDFPLANSIAGRYYWSADPYSDEVFYATQTGNHSSTLYVTKMKRLLYTLKYGEEGSSFSPPDKHRLHYIISGGAMFSYGLGNQAVNGHDIIGYLRSAHNRSDYGISCSRRVSVYEEGFRSLPSLSAIIVVRDVDYCLLYGLDDYDCQKEKHAYLLEKGLITEDGLGLGIILLIILNVFLSTMVILLLVCVCCMKRNLENSYFEDRGQPMVYYPNYPNLPRNSYLDDSVDTWRH